MLACCLSLGVWAQESNESNETPPNAPSSEEETVDFGIEFKEPLVQDGAYEKVAAKEKIALPYDHIREADVFWSKRMWRVIDTSEKMNLPFNDPNQPFISVMMDILQNHPDVEIFIDDTFTERQPVGDLKTRLNSTDTTLVYDLELDDYIEQIVTNEFNPAEFSQFRLKEDWLFDEETSTMVVRIMAIAPIRDVVNEDGSVRGQEALFWIYYPSLREYLVKYEAKNPDNGAVQLTWEDMFEMRHFSSYITKEANALDRRIQDYATGRDRLEESKRISEEMQNKEHDLWEH